MFSEYIKNALTTDTTPMELGARLLKDSAGYAVCGAVIAGVGGANLPLTILIYAVWGLADVALTQLNNQLHPKTDQKTRLQKVENYAKIQFVLNIVAGSVLRRIGALGTVGTIVYSAFVFIHMNEIGKHYNQIKNEGDLRSFRHRLFGW